MTTPGIPEKVKPETSKGHSSFTVRQWRPIWCQIPGALGARCGSFARIGLPVALRSPEIAQALEPMPSPKPSSVGSPLATCPTPCIEPRRPFSAAASVSSSAGGTASGTSSARSVSALRRCPADWSNAPLATAPCVTIGSWRRNGKPG